MQKRFKTAVITVKRMSNMDLHARQRIADQSQGAFSRIYSTTAKCATSKNYNKFVAGKTQIYFAWF